MLAGLRTLSRRECLEIVSRLKSELTALYGNRLASVILYGSHARGDAGPGSDVDIVVVLNGPVQPVEEIRRTGGVVSSLSLENDCVLSCVFLSRFDFDHRGGPFLRNVVREGIPV